MRLWISLFIVILLVLGAGGWYWHSGSGQETGYRTAPVQRGDIISTINATGTLEPEEVVDVGAQVAGLIESFGKDSNGTSIDYRSPVEPDMVLARIDSTVYKADVDTAEAELQQAKTNVLKTQADLAQANAKLLQAQHNWERAKAMGASDALSANDYDMYQADYESAKATAAVADAQVASAKSGILLSEASLVKAKRNLDFCTIKSPVKGVIIDRRVNIGQTVVSSLNAPSLFLIAKDLTRMQIWAAVNEADVGRIVAGTPVIFSCDAFPDHPFQGTVGKVRLNATVAQNVVMYTVEVRAENPGSILLPYMTAKVQFQVQKTPDVLMIPNAALRWYPVSPAVVSPAFRSSWKAIEDAPPAPDGGKSKSPEKKKGSGGTPRERKGTVWVKDGTFVKPVDIKLGVTDGTSSALVSGELAEDSEVIVGEISAAAAAGETNPFLPQFRRR